MKGFVAYDSVHGNTKQIAQAIADEIKAEGHEALLHSAREGVPDKLDADFMFIGSPTRMAKATRPAKRFVKKLAKSTWGEKPVCLFDTVMPGVEAQKGRWSRTAAQELQDLARDRGLNPHSSVLHAIVTGLKGPLAQDAAEKTKVFVREYLLTLKA